jgi:hypothetical protein
MADSGPGSWREGARIISLALVELTERIHAAISLRLQQTQAVAALLRRARDLATGSGDATQRARQYLWNASGSLHAALWVQQAPASDQQVRLDRWLLQKGGSPLPLVDERIWERALRPRTRPAPPQPPQPLLVTEEWDPGEDPQVRLQEEARERLVERLITAGSAQALDSITSLDELRLLASFLWLPRESAPLRRLGLRIQPAGAGMSRRAMLPGPGFEVEMDNYRFSATTTTRQAAAEQRRAEATQAAMARLSAIAAGADDVAPLRPAEPTQAEIAAATHPLEDLEDLEERDETPASPYATRELEAIAPAEARPAPRPSEPERAPTTGPRRLWPLPGLLRRGEARRPRE